MLLVVVLVQGVWCVKTVVSGLACGNGEGGTMWSGLACRNLVRGQHHCVKWEIDEQGRCAWVEGVMIWKADADLLLTLASPSLNPLTTVTFASITCEFTAPLVLASHPIPILITTLLVLN